MKWLGYEDTETTWEPKHHIDQHSLSEYIPSKIGRHRLRSASKTFEDLIQQRLRPGNRIGTENVKFDSDIYRY